MIMPARGSGPFNGAGMGGGDTHVHFNVQNIDSRGFNSWIKANRREIARTVFGAVRNNASVQAG
jgi:hypothetical protein